MPRPHLLMIGSGPEIMRGYMLQAAAARHPILLIDTSAPTWQLPYIRDHVVVSDLSRTAAVAAAADALAGRQHIGGIVTYDEFQLLTTAKIAEHLALLANSPAAVRACRDKATSRERLAAADVPSADFTWVESLQEAVRAADRMGFPVVLKPSSSAGSMGVTRADSVRDLARAWDVAIDGAAHQGFEGHSGGVLVEEYLDGPEISVETLTDQGITTPIAVTRKSLGYAPYFLETGHTVTGADPLLPAVAPTAAAALRALGITHGISHVEMRLTPSGPRIIEVNARLGGDRIGQLVHHATGIDLAGAAADLAMGHHPTLNPTRASTAAIGMLYPTSDGYLTQRSLQPGRPGDGVEDFQWLCQPGVAVTLTPSSQHPNNTRVGFAVVTGATPEDARHNLSAALERAQIRVHSSAAHAA
ncbi:ATP-grasp domain-containing protein [Streptomyces sp. NBC_00470]|uniref:ATP-grasp domain-containing protein n=1 Tax=Streptomyces sp. NBC_00470 TaxID=2975753 RepID=UPI002F90FC7A